MSIPEGYTYIRCDQYTPEEFRQMYTNQKGHVSATAKEYMMMHPKDLYNTDDEIAIRELRRSREVGSMYADTGKHTTKRYRYEQA